MAGQLLPTCPSRHQRGHGPPLVRDALAIIERHDFFQTVLDTAPAPVDHLETNSVSCPRTDNVAALIAARLQTRQLSVPISRRQALHLARSTLTRVIPRSGKPIIDRKKTFLRKASKSRPTFDDPIEYNSRGPLEPAQPRCGRGTSPLDVDAAGRRRRHRCGHRVGAGRSRRRSFVERRGSRSVQVE